LIGRGARYFPFQLDEMQDKYKRKFDEDIENELRIIETLHYHCFQEPKYIQEIKTTLTEMGILPEKYVQRELFIKESVRKKWKNDYIFINERIPNPRTDIKSFKDAKVEEQYNYEMKTGEIKEDVILDEVERSKKSKNVIIRKEKYQISDWGENVIRAALDKFDFYKFENLKRYYPFIKSIKEFIFSSDYLGEVEVEISGPVEKIKRLSQSEKLKIVLSILNEISDQTKANVSEFKGSEVFTPKLLWNVFKNKKIKIDKDDLERKELAEIKIKDTEWFGQEYKSEEGERSFYYGTTEEQNFINFISGFIEKLRQKYSDIALLRNEKFFQVFDFDEGRAFEPDFVLLLKRRNHKIIIYQIFIEPKGEIYAKVEPWKQKFLEEIEKRARVQGNLFIASENKNFKLVGLPFYNKSLEKEFEEAFENKLLN
ncbi:MAG: DEAD/DEAH box helicase family protein, partial [Minisyncoccia bacterium]